ncbi:hypothetical protein HispidOSU_000330 [Sigmodon hispidus]
MRSHSETQRHLHVQESGQGSQMPLQALVDRLQKTQAEKPQLRNAEMIAFCARAANPGQLANSGPGEWAQKKHYTLGSFQFYTNVFLHLGR